MLPPLFVTSYFYLRIFIKLQTTINVDKVHMHFIRLLALIMNKLITTILLTLIFTLSGVSQETNNFFPIVNYKTFNSVSIRKNGYNAVEVTGFRLKESDQEQFEKNIIYFDNNGKVLYYQMFSEGKVVECFDRKSLTEFDRNSIVENENWTYASEEAQKNDEPNNCLIEIYQGHIKQSLYENGLPIIVNHFISPIWGSELTSYYLNYLKEVEFPKSCLTKIQRKQIKQDSILTSNSQWPKDFLEGTVYNDSLSNKEYLSKINSFWDILISNEIESTLFEVKSWSIRCDVNGDIVSVEYKNHEITNTFAKRLSSCDNFWIANIVLISSSNGLRVNLKPIFKIVE
jgi:hypothetical protein